MSSDVPFAHIAFDLDDTLLDTSRLLIPQAIREASQVMITNGLAADVESCVRERNAYMRSGGASQSMGHQNTKRDRRHDDLFRHLVGHFGLRSEHDDPEAVILSGYKAFHEREVEAHISLFAGATEMLKNIRKKYGLSLVTAGTRSTQETKVKLLDLESYFDQVFYIDPSKGERKREAFTAITSKSDLAPERHLSIGNRLDTDIGEAKLVGWRTCWIQYGEYAERLPSNKFENPDFTVRSLLDVVSICRL